MKCRLFVCRVASKHRIVDVFSIEYHPITPHFRVKYPCALADSRNRLVGMQFSGHASGKLQNVRSIISSSKARQRRFSHRAALANGRLCAPPTLQTPWSNASSFATVAGTVCIRSSASICNSVCDLFLSECISKFHGAPEQSSI